MKQKGIRIALFVIEVFIGLCAIGGGLAILTNAFHFNQWLPVEWLADTPFRDYTVPGLVLLIIVGGGMLTAAVTVFVQRAWAVLFSAAMGLIMMGFEFFEATILDRYPQAVIPSTIGQQILMSGLGLVIFALACFLWMSEHRQQHFPVMRL